MEFQGLGHCGGLLQGTTAPAAVKERLEKEKLAAGMGRLDQSFGWAALPKIGKSF